MPWTATHRLLTSLCSPSWASVMIEFLLMPVVEVVVIEEDMVYDGISRTDFVEVVFVVRPNGKTGDLNRKRHEAMNRGTTRMLPRLQEVKQNLNQLFSIGKKNRKRAFSTYGLQTMTLSFIRPAPESSSLAIPGNGQIRVYPS